MKSHTKVTDTMINARKIRYYWQYLYIDTYLFCLLISLCAFGFFVLYSASANNIGIILKQGVHFFLAFGSMLVMAQIPPHQLKRFSVNLMILGVVLLILVLLIGVSSKGATRWLDLGVTRLQPSELMKIILPIAIAAILSKGALPPQLKEVFFSVLSIIAIVFLIYKQPDLGTSILIGASGGYILFFSGLTITIFKKWWVNLIAIATLGLSSGYILWNFLLHGYQKRRILTFLNPELDSLNSGYHITQSKIAIGSGGVFGKGWTNGSQSQLSFLPEHHTDFIFSVISEELVLIGILFLLLLMV